MGTRISVTKAASTAFSRIAEDIPEYFAAHSHTAMRMSLGIIFLWFGVLKFFPSLSSAEDLASRTIEILSFGLVKASISMPVLATWECIIGFGLILGKYLKLSLAFMALQMLGTFSPLFLFPQEMFSYAPLVATLAGQYILKNIVFLAGGMVVAGGLRQKRPSPTGS